MRAIMCKPRHLVVIKACSAVGLLHLSGNYHSRHNGMAHSMMATMTSMMMAPTMMTRHSKIGTRKRLEPPLVRASLKNTHDSQRLVVAGGNVELMWRLWAR
jgi:hypothetical protein